MYLISHKYSSQHILGRVPVKLNIPEDDGACLLFALVPYAGQEDEGGLRGGFKGTEQCPKRNQAREVFHCGVKREYDAPQDDI